MTKITQAHTTISFEFDAINEIFSQLGNNLSNVILFVSSQYDSRLIEQALTSFSAIPIFGCTTAGEIGSRGFSSHGISALGFQGVQTILLPTLVSELSITSRESLNSFFMPIAEFVKKHVSGWFPEKTFNILLADGLSKSEDTLTSALHALLPADSPVVGGSAGDDLQFKKTHVIFKGKYITDAALLLTVATDLQVFPFKTQHFLPSEKKVVATAVDEKARIVFRIDNLPAADAYARLIGTRVEELDSNLFSKYPLMEVQGEKRNIVSVQSMNPDKSLNFLASIPKEQLLHLALTTDYLRSLNETFDMIDECQNSTQAVLCFECVLRRLEVFEKNIQKAAGEIFSSHQGIGFHTYGEQYFSKHINQTLTGIAIGGNR